MHGASRRSLDLDAESGKRIDHAFITNELRIALSSFSKTLLLYLERQLRGSGPNAEFFFRSLFLFACSCFAGLGREIFVHR